MSETFEEMEERSQQGVEGRAGRMPEEKFRKVVGALEDLVGEEVSNRDERLGILRGLRHATRWAEAGEALDELAEAGWNVELLHHSQGWRLKLWREVEGEPTLYACSGWFPNAAGAIFAVDLATESLRPVPEVGGEDYAGIEREEGQ